MFQQPSADALPSGVRGLCFDYMPHCYLCGHELDRGHYFAACLSRHAHKWIRCFTHQVWALIDDKDLTPIAGQCACNVDDVFPQSSLVTVQWWTFDCTTALLNHKDEFTVPRGLVDYLTRVHIPSQGYAKDQVVFYKTSMRGVNSKSIRTAPRDWRTACAKMNLLTLPMYARFMNHWTPGMSLDALDALTVDKGEKHGRDTEEDQDDFDCQSAPKKQCQFSLEHKVNKKRTLDQGDEVIRLFKRMRIETV